MLSGNAQDGNRPDVSRVCLYGYSPLDSLGMDAFRRLRLKKTLLGVTVLILLLVQQAGLHVHNHEVFGEEAFTLHVLGGQQHVSPHDQTGEIEFAFSVLILKVLTMPDFLVTGMVLLLVLPLFSLLTKRNTGPRLKPRPVAFRLRPPARASPL